MCAIWYIFHTTIIRENYVFVINLQCVITFIFPYLPVYCDFEMSISACELYFGFFYTCVCILFMIFLYLPVNCYFEKLFQPLRMLT